MGNLSMYILVTFRYASEDECYSNNIKFGSYWAIRQGGSYNTYKEATKAAEAFNDALVMFSSDFMDMKKGYFSLFEIINHKDRAQFAGFIEALK